MMQIHDLDVTNKRVLMRVDFNVPMDSSGNITDDTRIQGVLPTIRLLIEKNARVVLCSHCGRPKGQRLEKFSLAPAAKRLSELLKQPVLMAPDCLGPESMAMADGLKAGEIMLLENLRFHPEEQKNDPDFAKALSAFGDCYINDAFAVSHRADASVEGVTHYFTAKAAGLLLYREIEFFNKAVINPARPLMAILGGAKVSSKLSAIRNMLDRVNGMIIGGAMANTFLKAQGHDIGSSLVENDLLDTARELLSLASNKNITIHLPTDFVVADTFAADATTRIVGLDKVPNGWMILDIGPDSAASFTKALAEAKTIVWNGPMGAFEMTPFANGSTALVQAVTNSSALSIVGGGDTNALINQANAGNKVSYMSTGGGAFLELMEGKQLPGVTALD
ncbi:MAG: phosphoglycerate kinase [Proteobacteria bacterium]|nr:phosphoglycerate kinase [Desulfobulbaceae bacterium]MBU4153271.1 phosphoglycerate kinase [Pseudomonadota bacterium]MDP2105769.1 phosphoglycerate kinase [Desulfobulbaceae bacterium]